MVIEERVVGDVTILDLKGKMTLGEGDELLKDKINSLIHQGQKKLLNLTKRITDLLSITKLLTVFETFDAEADALKSFQASSRV